MSLTVTNTAGSLGDWLSLTPLLAARPNSTVIAKDSPHTRRFARVYEGLANVEFTSDDIPPVLETDEDLCVSQRILNQYGVTEINAIPVVYLTEEEIEWARAFLAPYANPVAFNNTVAAARRDKPETDMCNYRRIPDELAHTIIKSLKDSGHTVIKFGTKTIQTNIYDNHDEFEGVVNLLDLNLRQLAACYHVIGRYVGSDSGDHHMMLAVGGRTELFIPPHAWFYNHRRHLYLDYAWKGEPVREVYHVFERTQS